MHPWIETLAWLSLLGTLQAFFGNACEAVVSVPNLMAIHELKLPRHELMFPGRTRTRARCCDGARQREE